ncbi:MAG TPA: DUF2254 family protein [Gemmatimonadaceae bacterium]|nr:DUF2254 family protein [Gemmatimonadaceae bacterium]
MKRGSTQITRPKAASVGARERLHRAFAEFLTVPSCIVVGFLLLAVATNQADQVETGGIASAREQLRMRVFSDAQSTADLLGTVASGIITVTSITISLLLLALQQSASAMTDNVLDQFLRRRLNQSYFGFFVGLSALSLLTLATVSERFNPVIGASVVFLLAVAALFLLLVLLYTTINQMRAEEIIEAIHGLTLAARRRSLPFINDTRREARLPADSALPVESERHGYLVAVDLDAIRATAKRTTDEVEVILHTTIGAFVAYGDAFADVRARELATRLAMAETVRRACRLELQRDIALDPAYGLEELELIAWTSISSSKSNPGPGMLTIRSLRDLLARWSEEVRATEAPSREPAPVVYTDVTLVRLMDALESLAVASTESMQHQCFAEVVLSFACMFDRLPADQQAMAERSILRILSGLGDHMLTNRLDRDLMALSDSLRRAGAAGTAHAVEVATRELGRSVGALNSRSSRVPD